MSPNGPKRSRWRVATLVFLACYVAAHFVLSRIPRVMVQRDWGIRDAFIYLPVRPDVMADHERPLLYVHHALRCFFFPIWKLDHVLLGGPWPMTSMPSRIISP
jgi:hypothetical protein